MEWIKWAHVDKAGRYLANQPHLIDVGSIAGGTAASMPPQVCHVVTLRGDIRRGSSAVAGRVYLPPAFSIQLDSGRMNVADAQTVATQMATLIKAINTANGGANGHVILASRQGKKFGPAMQAVTSVQCGLALDTQRRRRSAMREDYVTVPLG